VDYCIAVFDVGKTNKKVVIFDSRLEQLDSAYAVFPQLRQGDVELDDIASIDAWFLDQLAVFARRYPIRVVAVCTHGATFAAVDEGGRPVPGVISYTTDPGESFNEEFYARFGSSADLQRVTATPRFSSLLNVAKGVYFLKTRFAAEFARVRHILNYPQYFGYTLTGRVGAEATYVGCHSYLWDFGAGRWSSVARDLGIIDLLPGKVQKSWDVLGTVTPGVARRTGLDPSTIVTMGIHDSNASLLPYLIKSREDFVLNSTGTWCVAMKPASKARLDNEDIGKVVFYNLDAFSRPVKTTIFLGGMEFDTYTALFRKLAGRDAEPGFDPALYARILRERRHFILPEMFPGTGQFTGSRARLIDGSATIPFEALQKGEAAPAFARDATAARAVLDISLALQTEVAVRRAGMRPGEALYVEGGFRKNEAYNAVLAALAPSSQVSLTSMAEATAFGAAITGKLALEQLAPADVAGMFEIESTPVPRREMPGLDEYRQEFHSRLSAR
jgi:L-fuculokinase